MHADMEAGDLVGQWEQVLCDKCVGSSYFHEIQKKQFYNCILRI